MRALSDAAIGETLEPVAGSKGVAQIACGTPFAKARSGATAQKVVGMPSRGFTPWPEITLCAEAEALAELALGDAAAAPSGAPDEAAEAEAVVEDGGTTETTGCDTTDEALEPVSTGAVAGETTPDDWFADARSTGARMK